LAFHLHTDADRGYQFDAEPDPDPAYHFDADLNPTLNLMRIHGDQDLQHCLQISHMTKIINNCCFARYGTVVADYFLDLHEEFPSWN
jgi:hypothetical protein